MFEGVSVALVTPFKNGAVDEPGLRRLIRYVLEQGVDGLVMTGSTGEAATMSRAERERVWTIAREEMKNGAFLIAGTGSNSTAETIEATQAAANCGVDGALVVAPYYNKPSHAGRSLTSPRSRTPRACRSCCTTCRHAPRSTCFQKP